jgi:flagellar basal-body rod protein FlgC
MDFLKSLTIAAAGLQAQSGRMRVISENIANAESTAQQPGGDPYRRRIPTFRNALDAALGVRVVALGRVATDPSDFHTRYEPGHPAADASGMVEPAWLKSPTTPKKPKTPVRNGLKRRCGMATSPTAKRSISGS